MFFKKNKPNPHTEPTLQPSLPSPPPQHGHSLFAPSINPASAPIDFGFGHPAAQPSQAPPTPATEESPTMQATPVMEPMPWEQPQPIEPSVEQPAYAEPLDFSTLTVEPQTPAWEAAPTSSHEPSTSYTPPAITPDLSPEEAWALMEPNFPSSAPATEEASPAFGEPSQSYLEDTFENYTSPVTQPPVEPINTWEPTADELAFTPINTDYTDAFQPNTYTPEPPQTDFLNYEASASITDAGFTEFGFEETELSASFGEISPPQPEAWDATLWTPSEPTLESTVEPTEQPSAGIDYFSADSSAQPATSAWDDFTPAEPASLEQISLEPGAFLDSINQQLYPADPFQSHDSELDLSEAAFEEAAQYLFPETMGAPLDWQVEPETEPITGNLPPDHLITPENSNLELGASFQADSEGISDISNLLGPVPDSSEFSESNLHIALNPEADLSTFLPSTPGIISTGEPEPFNLTGIPDEFDSDFVSDLESNVTLEFSSEPTSVASTPELSEPGVYQPPAFDDEFELGTEFTPSADLYSNPAIEELTPTGFENYEFTTAEDASVPFQPMETGEFFTPSTPETYNNPFEESATAGIYEAPYEEATASLDGLTTWSPSEPIGPNLDTDESVPAYELSAGFSQGAVPPTLEFEEDFYTLETNIPASPPTEGANNLPSAPTEYNPEDTWFSEPPEKPVVQTNQALASPESLSTSEWAASVTEQSTPNPPAASVDDDDFYATSFTLNEQGELVPAQESSPPVSEELLSSHFTDFATPSAPAEPITPEVPVFTIEEEEPSPVDPLTNLMESLWDEPSTPEPELAVPPQQPAEIAAFKPTTETLWPTEPFHETTPAFTEETPTFPTFESEHVPLDPEPATLQEHLPSIELQAAETAFIASALTEAQQPQAEPATPFQEAPSLPPVPPPSRFDFKPKTTFGKKAPQPEKAPAAADELEVQWHSQPTAEAVAMPKPPQPQAEELMLGNLEVLSVCVLSPEKRLLVVQSKEIYALMGQYGTEQPQISVLKVFGHNPIAYQNTFTAVEEAQAGAQGMFVVQVGTWHAIISTFQDKITLHTELG